MRRRGVAALALAALLLPAAPGRADEHRPPPNGTITIRAAGHARVPVTVARESTIWLDTEFGEPDRRPVVTGGGTHAGFLLVPDTDDRITYGFVRRAGETPLWALAPGNIPVEQMRPGRYTLWVVADRPVEIRVRARGFGSQAWRATRRVAARTVTATFGDDPAVMYSRGQAQVTFGRDVVTVVGYSFRNAGQSGGGFWCATRADLCGYADEVWRGWAQAYSERGGPLDGSYAAMDVALPGSVPAGSWWVRWRLSGGVVTEPSASVLVIG